MEIKIEAALRLLQYAGRSGCTSDNLKTPCRPGCPTAGGLGFRSLISWGHIPFSHCLTLDKLEAEFCPMPLPSSLYAIQGHMTYRLGQLHRLGFCNSYLLADGIKPGVPS